MVPPKREHRGAATLGSAFAAPVAPRETGRQHHLSANLPAGSPAADRTRLHSAPMELRHEPL